MNLFKRFQVNRNPQPSEQQTAYSLEVGNAIEAFVSLEEIVPDLDWMEVLASSWGVPYATSEGSNISDADELKPE